MVAPAVVPRPDSLPENHQYVDTGCSIHPSCLTCPLERCVHDLKNGVRTLRINGRESQAIELRALNKTPSAIAAELGVSRRSVFRLLASARKASRCH